jgi:hypothetical protein
VYIENFFNRLCTTPSDINEHLPTLKKYATGCDRVVEMGVRAVVSTWALLAAKPKQMVSYDIQSHQNIGAALGAARQAGIDYEFRVADTLRLTLEPTDFLFIDTLHTYLQLSQELRLHADKVTKFIALHDTETFGRKDEQLYAHASDLAKGSSAKTGLMTAAEDFLAEHPEWQIAEHFPNNNGLTVLRRVV